ncbi:MAG: hypothetical protein ACREA0_11635, partial [bacterium]
MTPTGVDARDGSAKEICGATDGTVIDGGRSGWENPQALPPTGNSVTHARSQRYSVAGERAPGANDQICREAFASDRIWWRGGWTPVQGPGSKTI